MPALLKGGGSFIRSYRYWIEKKDGEHLNSGWDSENPGFLWRPTTASAAFRGTNWRNPLVDPTLVKELYEKSVEVDSQP